MPNLRQATQAAQSPGQVSGVDVGGNEFTLTETDIQPYIDNPELEQMEAQATLNRYGGQNIQGMTPETAGAPQGTPQAGTASAQGGKRPPVDFSRRGDFEKSVFKQLKSENMPDGNPFALDTTAKMNEITKVDLPQLFQQVFRGQVTWQDRHLLDDDQKKYWTNEVKAFRAHVADGLNSEKAQAIDMYNHMMNQFDNMAKEQEAIRKRQRQKRLDITKVQEGKRKRGQEREKDYESLLGKRADLLSEIREVTIEALDAQTAGTMDEARAAAYANQIQAMRDELKNITSQVKSYQIPKPKSGGPTPVAGQEKKAEPKIDESKTAEGTTVVRKKMPEASGKKTVVKTGTYKGKKVVQYSDGSISYAEESE